MGRAQAYDTREQAKNMAGQGTSPVTEGIQARVTQQLYQRRVSLYQQLSAVDKAIEDLSDPSVQKALNIFTQAGYQ